ncbi:metal-dependent hydrolase [Halobium palmae]|uniref:Metal-dependent hydrolase n=1 Tax=Halobium palmae TaxID=1776492 RepID=A0ABD5RXL1_9EURY
MQSPGHIGMALLFAAPAWFVFHGLKTNLAFTALAASTGMLPDGDLLLMRYVFVEHHGLTHSLLFIVPTALVLGGIATGIYLAVRGSSDYSTRQVYAFATVALFAGMLAHVFADVLTTPDIAPPIKPLYPLLETRLVLDAAFVKSKLWNLGTLGLGIVVQVGLLTREVLR